MEIKTKYYISHWESWPMCDKAGNGGKYVLSSSNEKDEVIFFEADSIEAIINELPNLSIDVKDVSVCSVQSLTDWIEERRNYRMNPDADQI